MGLIDEEEAQDDPSAEEISRDHHAPAREPVGDRACDGAEEGGGEEPQGELDSEEGAEALADGGASKVADQGEDRHPVEPVPCAGHHLREPELPELGVVFEDGEHSADCRPRETTSRATWR